MSECFRNSVTVSECFRNSVRVSEDKKYIDVLDYVEQFHDLLLPWNLCESVSIKHKYYVGVMFYAEQFVD